MHHMIYICDAIFQSSLFKFGIAAFTTGQPVLVFCQEHTLTASGTELSEPFYTFTTYFIIVLD